MMQRTIVRGASFLCAVALLAVVATPASAGAPPGKGLFSFGTWTCDGLGEVELVGPPGDKAASGYTLPDGEHIISFSLDIHGTFEGEIIDFSKTYGQRSALTPFTCIQHAEDAETGTNITLTLVAGLAPPR